MTSLFTGLADNHAERINKNIGTIIKNVKRSGLDSKTMSAVLNTQALKKI